MANNDPVMAMTTRILVTFGSKRGGTEEIAAAIARTLHGHGFQVTCLRAAQVLDVSAYDAVIVGGALYAGRWIREVRRFVARHVVALRARPVWLFSSGPLDASAQAGEIAPVRGVAAMMARLGARGHATFGGRLAADASGFPAAMMAKAHAGDWRDWQAVAHWSEDIACALADPPRRALAPADAPPPPPFDVLAAVCLFTGVTAMVGGAVLVANPTGAWIHLSRSSLAHTPFASFTAPGLILLLVVGLGNLLAGLHVRRRARGAEALAFAAGSALLGWIVTEMVMMRTVHQLQVTYAAAAVIIMYEALRRRRARPARSGHGRPFANSRRMGSNAPRSANE
jgi:menaquinone-dependent protoporphyrinogen oxidase